MLNKIEIYFSTHIFECEQIEKKCSGENRFFYSQVKYPKC